MLTILADENIEKLDDYMAHHNIKAIKLSGRDITQAAVDEYQPHALMIRSVTPINASTISDFGRIQFIGSATIGTDHIDQAHLAKHHISFTNAGGCSKHSVAQYAITAMLSTHPQWANQQITLGIVGLGNIGSALARYAINLGWQVLGYDPFLPKSAINNCTFDELLSASDAISIHTPLTSSGKYPTYQLFNKSTLSKLKQNALLINSARGEIICQDALIHAIDTANIQAVLDVFPYEPSIDKALLDKLTLGTPHIAGYTLEGKLRGTDMIYHAFCQTFGLPIIQQLDPLLPANPLTWTDFKQGIVSDVASTVARFYDIRQDDDKLRAVCGDDGVSAHDFDQLRKNYALRREWLFDGLS